MNYVVLSKIESQPFGIALNNGAWKLLKQKSNYLDCNIEEEVLKAIEQLCSNEAEKENCFHEPLGSNTLSWNKLISPKIASFIKKYHPCLQLEDISQPLGMTLFTHIIVKNINYSNWYGGIAGSVHFAFEQAKMRTISEILERTYLSQKLSDNIWSSAVATSPERAESNAKFEALERWIITRFWLNTNEYEIVQCLDLTESDLFQAVAFEWMPFSKLINSFTIRNPFGIPVVLTQVQVVINQQLWFFYGNGSGENLQEAVEKGLMETLQFIPRKDTQFYVELINSQDPAKKRVQEWSNSNRLKNDLSSIRINHSIPRITNNILDSAFTEANFTIHVEEITECPGIFIAYSTHNENWNSISGVPIA